MAMVGSNTTDDSDRPVIHVGFDIGSTTTKAVALDSRTHAIVYSTYQRHHAHQAESLKPIMGELIARFPNCRFRVAMSGSGGKAIADYLGISYIQEVVANAQAVQKLHPRTRCAIELGGQDAKMIFFDHDSCSNKLVVSDMRMNGSCAGGTGAFLDEIATLLRIPVEELNETAELGETVYSISGRCGVSAKTDIQPLLNQGARKEDIALSSFHAIAKQTLGGLAQGLDIHAPVIFEGGPLTFNPRLIDVFAQRLNLSERDIIVPDNPETIVAQGAALSLSGPLARDGEAVDLRSLRDRLDGAADALAAQAVAGEPFFASDAERDEFASRHGSHEPQVRRAKPGEEVRAYLGIDSGSTTTKFVLMDERGRVVDQFYASNEGEPLDIAKAALVALRQRYADAGIKLSILGCGTTGYGETLFAKAFHADLHVVETVAHARAATKFVPDASFILDIGGQDMKAIWLDRGVVTDIVVNEACSSGCGSFLENFASSLGIPTDEIAQAAFRAKNPAVLGSRCTVFMNSSVVTEQKNGKTPDDIMAGLCRSIIENVFTKVIRVPNIESLGDRIVVQGGTFKNDAVLVAFERYVGKQVVRAPYPGLMGAIGAALLTKQAMEERPVEKRQTAFLGLDNLDAFSYVQHSNVTCPFCANACSRTVVQFADGSTSVTGNRCERGEIVGDIKDESVRAALASTARLANQVPNLFKLRQKLLFSDYPIEELAGARDETIGLPRVLSFWDNAPFWTTFWRSLGFKVAFSRLSSRSNYESGLSAVASDTVCFPAKLVHGHLRDLVQQRVDRIFMPTITTVPSENTASTSQSMCAVVKGYSLVVRNSDNPAERFGVPFDDPLFHWYTVQDRERQLCAYMRDAFGIDEQATRRAIALGDDAMGSFRSQLLEAGSAVLEQARKNGTFAVVIGSRPYHNDPLVNHDVPNMFASCGIAVLPPDAVPGACEVDLSRSRIDIVNNFHARMLSCAILAAQSDHLEFVQLVSFGCGHDAYLSDEIVRLMHEVGQKSPLVLKVDESDVPGPLRIRVRSFVETVSARYKQEAQAQRKGACPRPVRELADPYQVKFTHEDRRRRVVLVPNTSHAFSRLMAAVFERQGLECVPLPIGRDEAIRLGKKYVHNDICFPAQIVIGEALAELETGKYRQCEVAVATGKYVGDCRLTHYAALLRKALDDAGYQDVPIITNDDVDFHNMQPGWKMNTASAATVASVLPMIDVLEELVRKMRPYELEAGAANKAFDLALDQVIEGIRKAGARGARAGFKRAIDIMRHVPYDRAIPRPRVLIVGEYLLNFHPGANHDIERYLEDNGFEVIEARMTDVIRKTYFYQDAQVREFKVSRSFADKTWLRVANRLFDHAHSVCDRIAQAHPLYSPVARMDQIVVDSDPIIHHTFDAGEGVLIPAEIIHHAKEGCRAFVILQPFGCLPNHVVGRGIAKRLKSLYPDAQILPLDYDPDVSFANVENRLQMLIMNAREKSVEVASVQQIIAEISGCAQQVAHIAQEMSDLAGAASSVVAAASEMSIDRMREMSAQNAAEALRRLQELAARAHSAAFASEGVMRKAGEAAQRTADAALWRLFNTAKGLSDLAQLASEKMDLCLNRVSWRVEEVRKIETEDRTDAALAYKLVDDARSQVDELSFEAESLVKQANDLLRRADEASLHR